MAFQELISSNKLFPGTTQKAKSSLFKSERFNVFVPVSHTRVEMTNLQHLLLAPQWEVTLNEFARDGLVMLRPPMADTK